MKMNAKQTIRGFLLLILLFLSQLIMALPPSKPVTFVHNEGPVVTVRWYAENAEGYRLFYAPYPEEEPIEMMEMGTRTEYSLRLPENSSYYVAVQAYNQDGDSPYSDSKYFVIDKFALMDIADVDPNALPLRFDHVAVDGHIAFLPTEADAEEQAQRLRTAKRINNRSKRANQLSSPVFQEDGKIGVRVDIAPGIVERDLLLSFCLEIGDECRTLLVWDDDAVNYYGETLFVPSVKTDVAKSLYADLLMPLEVINELRNLVKVPQEFNLRITAVNSINPQNIAVYVIKVPIVDVGDHQTRSIELNDGKISFASKNFGSDKFGVAFDIGMELYMYAGYFGEGEDGVSVDQAQYDGDFIVGIQAGPEISV
ncbi:MAG: fibronectin type III domain-containing protein, partial [Thiomargarita sp.]|nr:fibronectin type III domain-containing protein [Thiomargarita sp.]